MFCFNGDFRRKPEQNLSGANAKTSRSALISNAKQEREKRNEIRRKNENAIKIQSMVRSYIARRNKKDSERKLFEEYLKHNSLKNLNDLQYLLVKLLFFYDKGDEQRLIIVGQFVLKQSQMVFDQLSGQDIWQYRINRLLLLCITQLFVSDVPHAIPLRVLELFTKSHSIVSHIKDEERVRSSIRKTFGYLVKKNYFLLMRQLLELKTPPLDGPTTHPPNPFCDALLQCIIRPLNDLPLIDEDKSILHSFIDVFFSQEMSEPIRDFLLPYLAMWDQLPFAALIEGCNQSCQPPTVDSSTMTCYLLYAVLKLTEGHVHKLDHRLITPYLEVVAKLSPCIWQLPRKTVASTSFAHTDEDDESDEEEEMEMDLPSPAGQNSLAVKERETLQEILALLNEPHRTDQIMALVDENMDTNVEFIKCLCQICHILMVHNRSSAVFEYRLVSLLSAKTKFIRSMWHIMTTMQPSGQKFTSPLNLISKGIFVPESEALIPLLSTFCAVFSRLITTLHDDEFAVADDNLVDSRSALMPFSVNEVVALSAVLKDVCLGLVELAFPETRPLNDHYRTVFHRTLSTTGGAQLEENVKEHLFKVCVSLLRQIYMRDLRRNFCPANHWTVQTLNLPLDKPADLTLQRRRRNPRPFQPIRDFTREDLENGPPMSTKQMRSITILREIPFVVTFNERVNILQGLLAADKLKSQGDLQNFLQGPSLHIKIRRTHLYEDSFEKLSPENEPDLKPKLKVHMINAVGLDEAGIDGGGIFREFLSELIKTAFDPNRGFFLITTDNKLYPNPSVGLIVENYQKHYYFCGRLVGKALYENLLVELPLADFFLSKLAGKQCDVDIHQLASLDPVLHKNLLSLKAYDGDVSDLGLDFTVVSHELGETRVDELKPGGSNITVNSTNRIEYIQLMADYKLNKQIRKHCIAFREGLNNVLPIEWLFMYSNVELQVLISGAEIAVDITDLRLHTKYGGNFGDGSHPTIEMFWQVVEGFEDSQKRQLLKFVTSCSRPPLLGFKDLEPPFTIQDAVDTDRLPSASTCMNLLKLPPFQSADVLKEKLLYAINANTGFELS